MNAFQITMLAGAALLALSVFWPQIKGLVSSFKSSVVIPYAPSVLDEHGIKDSSLVEIIRCWEHLKVNCEKAGLNDACAELDKIFPLFVSKMLDKEVTNV